MHWRVPQPEQVVLEAGESDGAAGHFAGGAEVVQLRLKLDPAAERPLVRARKKKKMVGAAL
jgi:hypothetical protein